MWRLSAVYITAKNYSATYTILNSLGIFLGKKYCHMLNSKQTIPPYLYVPRFYFIILQTGREYYLTLVNSFWPVSNPFEYETIIDQPGLRVDLQWTVQGLLYALFNFIFGIWFWAETKKAVYNSHFSNNYEKSLATGGLVSCLINVITYIILYICIIISMLAEKLWLNHNTNI